MKASQIIINALETLERGNLVGTEGLVQEAFWAEALTDNERSAMRNKLHFMRQARGTDPQRWDRFQQEGLSVLNGALNRL